MLESKIALGDIKGRIDHLAIDLKRQRLFVAELGKPMIISTGGALIEDVQRAYDVIMPINPQLAILQCTAGYPAAFHELDLRVGDDVEHPAFGDGVIIEIRGQGDRAEATVRFTSGGTKHLSLAWAPLKAV